MLWFCPGSASSWGLGASEMAGLLLLETVMNLGLHVRVFFPPPPLLGARRRQAAAGLLATLSPWKEGTPLSALDLHLPAHTSCTGFNSTGMQLDGPGSSEEV